MEQEYFISMVRADSTIFKTGFFTGALYSGRDWIWDNHERITYPIVWNRGQPDNPGIENCLSIGKLDYGVGFNDLNCIDRAGFFCQKIGV